MQPKIKMVQSKTKSAKKHELIYVIAGKETSLVDVESGKLLDLLLEPQQRVTGFFDADPAQVSASDVLDELRTLPFLTETRVVRVRGADKFVSQNRQLLEKYFDNPCPTGVLMLTVANWDSRTKLAKKLPNVGKLINVTSPQPWRLPDRLTKYAADAHNKTLSKPAAELLVELAGDELTRLYTEIDKLALFTDGQKAITTEHIESLVGRNRMRDVFSVIDAITAGRVADAVDRLRNMFEADKSAEYKVLGAFAFHFRRMFSAKVLLEKGLSDSAVATRLHIWGNKEGFFAQLRKMTLKQIGSVLQQLAATDFAIKTGQTKAKIATEQLVLELVTAQNS